MAKLIDGKKIADTILKEVRQIIVKENLHPGLAIILVGDDQASQVYVRLKKNAAHKVGIAFHEYLLPKTASEKQVLETINWLNQDANINGLVLQLPLPPHLSEDALIAKINPLKDADGFHPQNLKKMITGHPVIKPALSQTVMALLTATDSKLKNKQALIISNSPIFATPLLYEFAQTGAEAFYLSPHDPKLKDSLQQADIIITAVGQPNLITDQACKKNSIVIDVGINKITNHTQGDADPKIYKKNNNVAWISPVPGGVGPVTIAMLLKNILYLTRKQTK